MDEERLRTQLEALLDDYDRRRIDRYGFGERYAALVAEHLYLDFPEVLRTRAQELYVLGPEREILREVVTYAEDFHRRYTAGGESLLDEDWRVFHEWYEALRQDLLHSYLPATSVGAFLIYTSPSLEVRDT